MVSGGQSRSGGRRPSSNSVIFFPIENPLNWIPMNRSNKQKLGFIGPIGYWILGKEAERGKKTKKTPVWRSFMVQQQMSVDISAMEPATCLVKDNLPFFTYWLSPSRTTATSFAKKLRFQTRKFWGLAAAILGTGGDSPRRGPCAMCTDGDDVENWTQLKWMSDSCPQKNDLKMGCSKGFRIDIPPPKTYLWSQELPILGPV